MAAQWVGYATAGVPRKADGKVDMTAPAPRLANGKPDFSGIWISDRTEEGQETISDASSLPSGRHMANMGVDMEGGLPYQAWQLPIVKERTENLAIDDPHIRCLPDFFLRAYGLPHMLKFVHTPDLLVMLNEMNAGYRQVFTDARALPDDPAPSWQGYSSAKWDGDTLVVDTIGVRDDTWIDWNGSVVTEEAKIREEIRRLDFGHWKSKPPSTIRRPTRSRGRSRCGSASSSMRSSSTRSAWRTSSSSGAWGSTDRRRNRVMKRRLCVLSRLMIVAVALPAAAHHSFPAQYDIDKPISLTGKVTKVEWTNPHIFIYADVTDANGAVVSWAFEMGGPNALLRQGWKRDSLKPGDTRHRSKAASRATAAISSTRGR